MPGRRRRRTRLVWSLELLREFSVGAPEGNANRLTTGDRSALLLPQLGKALGPIGKVGRKYRRTLEGMVLAVKNEVAADDAQFDQCLRHVTR